MQFLCNQVFKMPIKNQVILLPQQRLKKQTNKQTLKIPGHECFNYKPNIFPL